jgi:hypothetical protein
LKTSKLCTGRLLNPPNVVSVEHSPIERPAGQRPPVLKTVSVVLAGFQKLSAINSFWR